MGIITNIIDSLLYRTYNCVRVNTGSYLIGNGMGAGRSVICQWRIIRGDVIVKQLKPIKVRNGDHDSTISTLNTLVLYPKTSIAIVEISNRHGCHRYRLVSHKKGKRSSIHKERL